MRTGYHTPSVVLTTASVADETESLWHQSSHRFWMLMRKLQNKVCDSDKLTVRVPMPAFSTLKLQASEKPVFIAHDFMASAHSRSEEPVTLECVVPVTSIMCKTHAFAVKEAV
eukprot:4513214-Amphidinium_carterae.1